MKNSNSNTLDVLTVKLRTTTGNHQPDYTKEKVLDALINETAFITKNHKSIYAIHDLTNKTIAEIDPKFHCKIKRDTFTIKYNKRKIGTIGRYTDLQFLDNLMNKKFIIFKEQSSNTYHIKTKSVNLQTDVYHIKTSDKIVADICLGNKKQRQSLSSIVTRFNTIYKYNRKVFRIPDINRTTTDISLEHCELRFPNHTCIECGWFRTIIFLLTGY